MPVSYYLQIRAIKSLFPNSLGTGSILEGLRAQLPLIVVPNTDLADNHQEQLAIELDRTKYAVNSLVE